MWWEIVGWLSSRPAVKSQMQIGACAFQSDATTDVEQIEHWWDAQPAANVAIATEGLVVLDIDGKANHPPSRAPVGDEYVALDP